jgi:uroporphyrinogen decarboxylase
MRANSLKTQVPGLIKGNGDKSPYKKCRNAPLLAAGRIHSTLFLFGMSEQQAILKAIRREQTDFTPVWFMRQAGRYLKEYRDIRAKYSFLEMCKTIELIVEITLQPVRKLEVDAAILFSDILLPLEGMGIKVSFEQQGGPSVCEPVKSTEQVEKISPLMPEEHLPFCIQAVKLLKKELKDTALIGFCGAPFTIASYLIEGKHSIDFSRTKRMMSSNPGLFKQLMSKLTDSLVSWLNTQADAGVDAVQVFDSWIGVLSPPEYKKHVLPHMKKLFSRITVPSIHFGTMTSSILTLMKEAGGDVLGIDWRMPIDAAWKIIGSDRAIQGNLDPAILFAPVSEIKTAVKDILSRISGRPGHIFNTGHGILPETPVGHVRFVVDLVHESSSKK